MDKTEECHSGQSWKNGVPPENLRIIWLDFQVGNELVEREKEEV